MNIIETERLLLRTWKKEDSEPYYKINQDPKVTEFLLGSLSMKQVEDFIEKSNRHQDDYGYTLWAAELKTTGELMGFIGLCYREWKSHFTPAVEIAWRLRSEYWNNGYATEGAKAALNYGFDQHQLQEIVSFTVPMNKTSIRVMEKIGMQRDLNGDFIHPLVPPDHILSKHVLYRIKKPIL